MSVERENLVVTVVLSSAVDDWAHQAVFVAEGIAKCIVIVVDTAGARTHAPRACVQGYSRSRVAKW